MEYGLENIRGEEVCNLALFIHRWLVVPRYRRDLNHCSWFDSLDTVLVDKHVAVVGCPRQRKVKNGGRMVQE